MWLLKVLEGERMGYSTGSPTWMRLSMNRGYLQQRFLRFSIKQHPVVAERNRWERYRNHNRIMFRFFTVRFNYAQNILVASKVSVVKCFKNAFSSSSSLCTTEQYEFMDWDEISRGFLYVSSNENQIEQSFHNSHPGLSCFDWVCSEFEKITPVKLY